MRLRRLAVAVAAVALGASACGGDDTPSADETPSGGDETGAPSAAATEGAGETDDSGDTAGESTEDETAAAGAQVDAAELFGAMSDAVVEAGSYEFETTMDAGGAATVSGAVQVGAEVSETNMRIQADMQGVATTILLVDGQVYIELTEDMGLPSGQGSWMTVDPQADDAFSQQMAQSFEAIGSATDLSAQLAENPELLTVTEVGGASVDGVDTTEYLVTVNDIAEFMDVPEADVQVDELAYSMWVDGDDLPRRMTTDAGVSASLDVTYSNYGVDVQVEAPPADEVVDLSELMNQ